AHDLRPGPRPRRPGCAAPRGPALRRLRPDGSAWAAGRGRDSGLEPGLMLAGPALGHVTTPVPIAGPRPPAAPGAEGPGGRARAGPASPPASTCRGGGALRYDADEQTARIDRGGLGGERRNGMGAGAIA